MSTVPTNDEQLRAEVSARYARTALQVLGTQQSAASDPCCAPTCCTPTATAPALSKKALPVVEADQTSGCCGSSCCTTDTRDASVITSDLYSQAELGTIPVAAALASLGCGNPTALAELKPGERVLDAQSVDVVISNCVINLSADKGQVLREAYRVLAPGGRFAVSDIVFQGHLPQALCQDMESWAGCIAGALEETTYRDLLHAAGFSDIEVELTRRYALQDIADGGASASLTALGETERSDRWQIRERFHPRSQTRTGLATSPCERASGFSS